MKRIIYLIAAFTAFVFLSNLTWADSKNMIFEEPLTTFVKGKPDDFFIKAEAKYKNTSSSVINIKVHAKATLSDGHKYTICDFSNCYQPDGDFLSDDTYAFKAGETQSLTIDLAPNNKTGTSSLVISILSQDDANDFIRYTLTYIIDTTLGNTDSEISDQSEIISNPFPNPSSGLVQFNLNLPQYLSSTNILIYNELGTLIREVYVSWEMSSVAIGTESLAPGIYFYRLSNSYKEANTGSFTIVR